MDIYQKREQRKKNKAEDENKYDNSKMNINWYPGHMVKTKREINELLNRVDIVIEIVDARIPVSSHNKDIEEFNKDKKKIMVFSKYDLCDKTKTDKFIKYYEDLNYNVITCDFKNSNDYKKITKTVSDLMIKTNEKRKNKGLLPKIAKVLVVGVPNVGKSTLINRIAGKRVSEVQNKPGITRNISSKKINNRFDLIDTPGILWPKIDSEEVALNLGSMSVIKEDVLPLDKIAMHILRKLNKDYKDILYKNLGIIEYNEDNIEEVYMTISKYKGIKITDGEVDYNRVNEFIINLVKSENIKNITFD